MGYWYIKAKITELQEFTSNKRGIFGHQKVTKKNVSRYIEGKVVGIGNTGCYGSWPCYMVAVKEGVNPKVESVYMDNDVPDGDATEVEDFTHEILELTYRSK